MHRQLGKPYVRAAIFVEIAVQYGAAGIFRKNSLFFVTYNNQYNSNNYTMKAYLQNKKGDYYCIGSTGKVELTDQKTALYRPPEIMASIDELKSDHGKYKDFEQTGLIFSNEAYRIVSHLFFRQGNEADCIFTLEGESICGNLDFSSARIYGGKEMRICCVHF